MFIFALLLKIVLEVLARVTGQEEKQGTQTDSTTVTSYNGPWKCCKPKERYFYKKEEDGFRMG